MRSIKLLKTRFQGSERQDIISVVYRFGAFFERKSVKTICYNIFASVFGFFAYNFIQLRSTFDIALNKYLE